MIATTARRFGHRIEALPRPVHIALWLLLVILFAGPSFLLLFIPVAAAVWLWETSRSHTFDIWGWTRHLFEMVVAMYVGMLVYHMLVALPLTRLGVGSLVGGDLGYTWMTLSMVVPMVALMRFRGHTWRMANEMSLGMVGPIVVCFALVRLGICSLVPFLDWLTPTSVYPAAYYGMLLGMIAVMVYRRGMYAARDETAARLTSLTPTAQTGSLT
jgi:hypothetical protein